MTILRSGKVKLCVASLLMSLLGGCASLQTGEQQVVVVPEMPLGAEWRADITDSGRVVTAHYADERAMLVSLDGKSVFDSRKKFADYALSGLALATYGEELWWAFRPKEPQREVVILSSAGFQASIDDQSLPLPRISLLPDEQGVDVFWTGERFASRITGEPAISRARFMRNGTLLHTDEVALGELPKVEQDGQGRKLLVTNHSYASGGSVSVWIEDVAGKVASSDIAHRVASVQPTGLFMAGSRAFAYWNNESRRNDAIVNLELAWSDDGAKWHPVAFDWPEHVYPDTVRFAHDGGNNLILAIESMVTLEEGQRVKRVRLFRSFDKGENWSGPFEVRANAFDYAREASAEAVYLEQTNQFMVLWTDWRFTRPTLRYSLFDPAVVEPIVHDAPFSSPATLVAGLPEGVFDQPVFVVGGEVKVVAERPDDGFQTQSLIVLSRDIGSLQKILPDAALPDMKRLEQRVNAFGKAFVDKRYADIYATFDPFYRARVSFQEFLETQGRVEYKAYEYLSHAEPQGVASNVTVRIVASVPKFVTPNNAKFEGEEREVESVGRWLWIDGEWYREFFSAALEQRYTRH